ncbi:hypothetical protein NIES2119_02530 [[Phormidium ambiguum] IAM M-71]|uniref:Uncharacterized protein n=1 Tax=[Phormidium ambiguum] IAM M-71 TaxID=454136 RepID=A0A1U7IST3_9CYAN|nr:hypothetical protein [Phormidium ambiguum]OKH40508.1 hypothetical protein NIES2119_02530 [Phormidium ambiguum IAM M-71]
MKSSLNHLVSQVINTTLGALTLMLFFSSPLLANNVPQQITNGLYRSSSQDFFEQGKRQFDKEIEILIQQLLIEPESLLNISDEVQIKEQKLENLDVLSDNLINNSNRRKSYVERNDGNFSLQIRRYLGF